MDVETIKELIKTLSWRSLKNHLNSHPLKTVDEAVQLFTLVCHSDRMVRRRATDDGKRRDKFLDSLAKYFFDCDYEGVANGISEAREVFAVIDTGYSAIFDVEQRLPTASWSSVEKVSSAMALLSSALKQIEQDMNRSLENSDALEPEPKILDPEGRCYNPAGVFHHLAIATGNIIMMEAYRANWFSETDELVLPQLPNIDEQDARPILRNFATAHNWQQWKAVDEKVRFLGGDLRLVNGEPEWIGRIEIPSGVHVKQALEFDVNVDAEVYCVLATERFDERQRQTFFGLMAQTNISEKVTKESAEVDPVSPPAFISFAESHASETLYRALSMPLDDAQLGELTVAELLRGYSLLHLMADKLYRASDDLFPSFSQDELMHGLILGGLSSCAAQAFLVSATFRRSSRDLYDAPLIRCADGSLILFGWAMLHPDLPKVVLSSMSKKPDDIDDKGLNFERRVIDIFKAQGFDAKNIKVKRGPDRAVYDYDVVFTWDDYVFLFECKNRSLPGDNPIAIYYFNHSIESHVKQVQRLRNGLEAHPDILSECYPSAVGKKQVFCVIHGLPFARHPIDGIYFSDESLIQRFFDSPSLGLVTIPLKKNTGIDPTKLELARIWVGEKPTAEDLARYLADPPQIRIAAAHYQQSTRAEWLSETVIAKFNFLHRVGANVGQVAAAMKSNNVSAGE